MSNDTQFLDVDAIAPKVKKVISIHGRRHEFQTPRVKDFIRDITRVREMREKYGDADKLDEGQAAELMVAALKESVKHAFPTVTDEDLDELSFEQLTAIRNFIAAQVEEAAEGAEDAQGNA